MVTVGSFDMDLPEEAFWEIYYYFIFLITDNNYQTEALKIGRDAIYISYSNKLLHKKILIKMLFEYRQYEISFRVFNRFGKTLLNVKEDDVNSIVKFAEFISLHYSSYYSR